MPSSNLESETVTTAYGEKASSVYDERRFSTPHGKLFNRLEMEQLSKISQGLTCPSRILEVGCGTGRFMHSLCADGHEVYGVDPSPFMLVKSRTKNLQFSHAHYEAAEGGRLPFLSNAFDFVYSIRVINQVGSLSYAFGMIGEMIRVCRPGDRYWWSLPTAEGYAVESVAVFACPWKI